MSDPRPETSLTAAAFRAEITSAYEDPSSSPRRVEFLGSFSDGSRYMVEDGMRQLHWYLVTDLLRLPFLEQAGSTSLTFIGTNLLITKNLTITATKAAFGNYVVLTQVQQGGTGSLATVQAKLTTSTNLLLQLQRGPNTIAFSGATQQDIVNVGLTGLIVPVGADHQHGVGPASFDPNMNAHDHPLGASASGTLSTTETGVTVTVYYAIIRIS